MCQLLKEVGIETSIPGKLWCDNQVVMHIASNPVFYERTKHIEIDCHFIREKIQLELISTRYVKIGKQLGDIFTKPLSGDQVSYLCNKLGMINTMLQFEGECYSIVELETSWKKEICRVRKLHILSYLI